MNVRELLAHIQELLAREPDAADWHVLVSVDPDNKGSCWFECEGIDAGEPPCEPVHIVAGQLVSS